jgi:L-alanine-DL-glutamate epimerase-like enolase superfamily enzyme
MLMANAMQVPCICDQCGMAEQVPLPPLLPITYREDVLAGYSDAQVAQLTQDAVDCGFTHFKMKVGLDVESDLRRGRIIRGIIDQAADAEGKRRDSVLMIDANQVWDVDQAVAYVSRLAELRPWFVPFICSRTCDGDC